MCGITGFFSISNQPSGLIRRMTDLLSHRGPDDEGHVLFRQLGAEPRVCGGPATPADAYHTGDAFAPQTPLELSDDRPAVLALGHRRLSILDLSPLGHQPMCSPDGDCWIVYNGEVYNHLELRTELEGLGCTFRSRSDTEVILAAYQTWGTACLQRFNGMFAFLLFDRKTETLFIARDRFGVKPLYYRVSTDGLAFASEIKAFTALPGWRARANGQRTYDFLNWGITEHTDETLFAGVHQLRGGQMLELRLRDLVGPSETLQDGQKLPAQTWYHLQPRPFTGGMSQASEGFQQLLIDSVRLRLRADVPVGSCLSGGLDSSSIVCIANRLLREQDAHGLQRTFSACAVAERYDERKWVDIVVGATGVQPSYVYPPLGGLFEEAPRITWHQDEPFGSTSMYAQWQVFELASKAKVRVMLDGQGADEQLAGYHGFFGPRLASSLRDGNLMGLWREASGMKRLHGYGYGRSLAYLANHTLPERLKNLLRKSVGRAITQPAWLDNARLGCEAANPFIHAGSSNHQDLLAMSLAHLQRGHLQMLLHWEDRNAMAHSIESRVPFLDYRLVEFVLGLPDDCKLSEGVTKRVLRQAMSGIIPDAIRDRMDKKGFVTPEETWLREGDPDLFRRMLGRAIEGSGGILRAGPAMEELDGVIAGRRPFSFLPWRMINFGEWIKRFDVST